MRWREKGLRLPMAPSSLPKTHSRSGPEFLKQLNIHISVLLDRGVDLATAVDLAGHVSPNTTKRYD